MLSCFLHILHFSLSLQRCFWNFFYFMWTLLLIPFDCSFVFVAIFFILYFSRDFTLHRFYVYTANVPSCCVAFYLFVDKVFPHLFSTVLFYIFSTPCLQAVFFNVFNVIILAVFDIKLLYLWKQNAVTNYQSSMYTKLNWSNIYKNNGGNIYQETKMEKTLTERQRKIK